MKINNGLFIFRRDLRLIDNIGLLAAYKKVDNLYTCFIFTPEQVTNKNDFKSKNSIQFMIESLKELEDKINDKGGKLIIFDAHCSILLQLVLILMKHEGFDFTKNVWSLDEPSTDDKDLWSGNSAIPYLIFNDKKIFREKLGSKFNLKHLKLCECLLFLNSGGVTSKTFYIPLNFFFLKIIKYIDITLSLIFPKLFSLAYKIVLEKK